jgi:hypothetical protein
MASKRSTVGSEATLILSSVAPALETWSQLRLSRCVVDRRDSCGRCTLIATISTFEETNEQLDEGVRQVREEVVPSIQGVPGLRAGYWLVNRESGKRWSVVICERAFTGD